MARTGIGCLSALAGSAAVVFGLAPSILGDWWQNELEEQFALHHEGSLDVDTVTLHWDRPHVLRRAVLYDPEGEVVGSGDVIGPSLLDILDGWSSDRPRGHKWRLERVTGTLRFDAAGLSNVERALALESAPEGGGLRAVAFDSLRLMGMGRLPLELEFAAPRIEVASARSEETSSLEDLKFSAQLVPGRPAKLSLIARTEGGAINGHLDLDAPNWHRFPSEMGVELGLTAGLPRSLASVFSPALAALYSEEGDTLELSARIQGREGPVEVSLVASLGDYELDAQGILAGSGWLNLGRPHPEPALEGAHLEGWLKGFAAAELAGGDVLSHPWVHSLSWRGEPTIRLAFDHRTDVTPEGDVQGPFGSRVALTLPDWEVELGPVERPERVLGVETELTVAWAGSSPAFAMRGRLASPGAGALVRGRWDLVCGVRGLPGARHLELELSGEGSSAHVTGAALTPEGLVIEPGGAWLEAPIDSALGTRIVESIPHLASLQTAGGAPARWDAGPLVLGGDEGLAGTLRLTAPGARWTFADAFGALFVPAGRSGTLSSAPWEFEIGPEAVALSAASIVVDGSEAFLGGRWQRDGSALALSMRIASGLVAPSANSFVGEYGQLIAADVLLPLEVEGPVHAPRARVAADFRADLLDGVVGSLRGVVDYLEETPRDLVELVGDLLDAPEPQTAEPQGTPPEASQPEGAEGSGPGEGDPSSPPPA